MNYNEAVEKLQKFGQTHVLKYYDELLESQKLELLAQIEATDFSVTALCNNASYEVEKGVITPLAAMQLSEIEANKEEFRTLGVDAIKKGKVGAVLLAGGMGTRLGSDDPKGMYNIGLTKDVYIFERIVNNLMDVVKETSTWIHLFIMTSDKNHDATTRFFKEHDYFGYN